MKFLHLNFIPRSADVALLALRLWYGLALFSLYGWAKVAGFGAMSAKFADPLGVGHTASLSLAIFAELICSLAVVAGVFTRFAALCLIINMAVAYHVMQPHAWLPAIDAGEKAYLYLGAFVALFLAGAGKFSVDAKLGAKA